MRNLTSIGGLAALGALLASGCASAPKYNPWAQVSTPAQASPDLVQSIGGYSAGCIRGAASPPPDGLGFAMMRPRRGRFYGHPDLVRFIQDLGARVAKAGLGSLLIGDMGQPRGGPAPTGHRSHQTGLDVDIWYWQPVLNAKQVLTLDERETLGAPSMVAADQSSLAPQWSEKNVKILKMAAESPEVERIFVNAAIKRSLCKSQPQAPARRAWLAKLRPWWGHDDHFHVRLKCREKDFNSGACKAQEKVPAGDGCDATLDWWFTEEARKKSETEAGAQSKLPVLPKACDEVLKL
jgi:penicillin-insensitive murein endopeptidase